METRDALTIIGWPISCILSILAGGILVPKLTRKRKILSWAVISENDLIPKDLQTSLSVPVKIEVGGAPLKSLCSVSIKIGNSGNEVIENQTASISVGSSAKVLYFKPSESMGEFAKHFTASTDGIVTTLHFDYLNPDQSIELEFLLSDYEQGTINFDAAGPGLTLRRTELSSWNMSTSILRSVSLSLMGIKYDPSVSSMSEIAAELKSLRRYLQSK